MNFLTKDNINPKLKRNQKEEMIHRWRLLDSNNQSCFII